MTNAWDQTPENIRQALGDGFRAQLVASAQEFDRQRQNADNGLSDINAQVMGSNQEGEA